MTSYRTFGAASLELSHPFLKNSQLFYQTQVKKIHDKQSFSCAITGTGPGMCFL